MQGHSVMPGRDHIVLRIAIERSLPGKTKVDGRDRSEFGRARKADAVVER